MPDGYRIEGSVVPRALPSWLMGERGPRAAWRRLGSYEPLMRAKTAMLASASVRNFQSSSSSHPRVAKKPSRCAAIRRHRSASCGRRAVQRPRRRPLGLSELGIVHWAGTVGARSEMPFAKISRTCRYRQRSRRGSSYPSAIRTVAPGEILWRDAHQISARPQAPVPKGVPLRGMTGSPNGHSPARENRAAKASVMPFP